MGAKGEKNKGHKVTEKQVLLIRKMYAERKIAQKDLAAMFGISQHAISDIVNGATWRDVGGPITHGIQRSGKAFLTPTDVALIRKLRKDEKYKMFQLAEMFDISREQVMRIIHRKSWVHVLDSQEDELIINGVHPLHPSVISRDEAWQAIMADMDDKGVFDDPQDFQEPEDE